MLLEKVYISAPFRYFASDEEDRFYGVFQDREYKEFLEKVDHKLKSLGYETCLPHRDEGEWGDEYILPEDVAEICFKHIESSSLVIVFPGKSRGVHMEVGYAAALRKRIVVFLPEGEGESTLLRGLRKVTDFKCFRYKCQDDVLKLLDVRLRK